MPTWNPDQYLKFDEERTQPCRDLVYRVANENVQRIIDLGCGPGNSTRVLAERWPDADIVGLDSSRDMIDKARATESDWTWIADDIAHWAETSSEVFDLVFSNAAMQWVPDHPTLYPKLLERASHGGAFAVQVPANFNGPAHRLMREMAASPSWRERMPGDRIREWHSNNFTLYYDLLAPICRRVDIWETEYIHSLPDAGAIVEWYKGTGLRPFLDALQSKSDREDFIAEYLEGIRKLYPPRPNGRVLFPFRRSFLVAYR
jgi:trans-aconitate 2-methyltransferase